MQCHEYGKNLSNPFHANRDDFHFAKQRAYILDQECPRFLELVSDWSFTIQWLWFCLRLQVFPLLSKFQHNVIQDHGKSNLHQWLETLYLKKMISKIWNMYLKIWDKITFAIVSHITSIGPPGSIFSRWWTSHWPMNYVRINVIQLQIFQCGI